MRYVYKIGFVLLLSTMLISCNAIKNANNTQKGAGIGVAAGAIAGGIIGGNLKGALIGAAIGGASGGIIGNIMDKQARKIEEAVPGADVERVGEGILVIFDENSGINFETNKADLSESSKSDLREISKILIEFPDTNITVQGHTDSTGNEDYNMALSKRRAESVVTFFKQNGVASSRFRIEALGETMPRYDNGTVEGRAKNRRVELAISANEEMIKDAQAKSRN